MEQVYAQRKVPNPAKPPQGRVLPHASWSRPSSSLRTAPVRRVSCIHCVQPALCPYTPQQCLYLSLLTIHQLELLAARRSAVLHLSKADSSIYRYRPAGGAGKAATILVSRGLQAICASLCERQHAHTWPLHGLATAAGPFKYIYGGPQSLKR